jgi:transcriptional regulator with XRE-family HTH domain
MKYLAKNLKWLRTQRGLKQTDLLKIIGFKSTTWNNYEKGVSKPGLDDMMKISKYFGYTETDILHRDLEVNKIRKVRQKETDYEELNVVSEERVEYKKLCRLKDQIIAAQQGEIEVLTVMATQREEGEGYTEQGTVNKEQGLSDRKEDASDPLPVILLRT